MPRSENWPSASISIPSASHASIRETYRVSGNSACSRARAAQTTQRWFGVWMPPTTSASPAARAKRSRSATARGGTSGRARRTTASDAQTGSSTKAVSGGEWKFVVGRSIVPSECWRARSARDARLSRSPISGEPRYRDPGAASPDTSACARPAVPPPEGMPCSSRSAPRHGCEDAVSCRSSSAGMRESLARTSRSKTSPESLPEARASRVLAPIVAAATPAPATCRNRRLDTRHLVGQSYALRPVSRRYGWLSMLVLLAV